ncbi:MAG: hypothetical protein HY335_08460 [Deinococcus sp.]|nr:hypothetical protein [Deinococcus sp.]
MSTRTADLPLLCPLAHERAAPEEDALDPDLTWERVHIAGSRVVGEMLCHILRQAEFIAIIRPLWYLQTMPVYLNTWPGPAQVLVPSSQAEEARTVLRQLFKGAA